MTLSIIAAVSENNVIGVRGHLPWDLPDDLKHFREITAGHPVIMGKGTYTSLPGGALPHRRNIVIAREKGFAAPGCEIVRSPREAASAFAGTDEEVFVIGGGAIYRQFMDRAGDCPADRLYLTRVHANIVDGDTFFPHVSEDEWEEVERSATHPADARHRYPFMFITYERRARTRS